MAIDQTERINRAAARRGAIPYVVLLTGLLLSAAAARYVEQSAEATERLRFNSATTRTRDAVANRLDTYIALLRAAAGLFAAKSDISREEFRTFVERLQVHNRYPGVQGIGYSLRVPAARKAEIEDRLRAVGWPSIWPPGLRPEYHPIFYLEPADPANRLAFSYDMHSDDVRAEAMDRARDTGQVAASGEVRLVQEGRNDPAQPGFLIYLPIYSGGVVPATISERKRKLTGFLYAPFRADDFIRGILGPQTLSEMDLRIEDTSAPGVAHTLYPLDPSPAMRTRSLYAASSLQVAGRRWRLQFSPRPTFDQAFDSGLPPWILGAGFALSLLLYFVTGSEVRARNASELRTAELRRSDAALRDSEARLRKRADEMELLYEAGRVLGATLDPNRVYDALRELISDVMECTSLLVFSFDAEEQMIRCSYAWLDGERTPDPAVFPPIPLAPEGRGIQSEVIRTGRSQIVGDMQAEMRKRSVTTYHVDPDGTVHEEPSREEMTQSALIVPIKLEEHVIGTIQVLSTTRDAYTEEHLRIVEGMVLQMAAASRNAYLYQHAQDEIAERRRAESEIARRQVEIQALNRSLQRAMTETHHRVKNNLQIIAAMVDMRLMDGEESISAVELRRLGTSVLTLAAVHDVLTRQAKEDGHAESVSVREVLERLLPLMQQTAHGRPILFRVDDVEVSAHRGTSLALIANELVSNAIKHGSGPVDVSLRVTPADADTEGRGQIVLEVCDSGPGFPDGFNAESAAHTGLELVCDMSRWDLRGQVEFGRRESGGGRVTITIPLEEPSRASHFTSQDQPTAVGS